jgi:hypothetical protein
MMQMLRTLALFGLLGLLAIAGCPHKEEQPAQPEVKIRRNTADTNEHGAQLVQDGLEINKPAPEPKEGK